MARRRVAFKQIKHLARLVSNSGGGWFGLTAGVKTEGAFWDPSPVSITTEAVTPGSLAAAQHVTKGDEVLEIQGQNIAGRKGADVKAILESKSPGDTLVVRFKRPSGETYVAMLVAAKRP